MGFQNNGPQPSWAPTKNSTQPMSVQIEKQQPVTKNVVDMLQSLQTIQVDDDDVGEQSPEPPVLKNKPKSKANQQIAQSYNFTAAPLSGANNNFINNSIEDLNLNRLPPANTSNLSSIQRVSQAGFERSEPITIEAVGNSIEDDGSDSPPEFVIKPFEKSIE